MAIYSSVPPPNQQQPTNGTSIPISTSTASVGIDTWTGEALQSLTISVTAGGTENRLSIPLDGQREGKEGGAPRGASRGKILLRDSQRRRDALLKGKEGSRRRQRWENDRLLHVPNVQPPLPSDWEVHPTHPVNPVPYYLAHLWETGVRRRAEEAAKQSRARKSANMNSSDSDKGRVPAELKEKLKRSKGAKILLMDLEEQIRHFVQEWEAMSHEVDARLVTATTNLEIEVETDSSDEEIVFVGRQALRSDTTRGQKSRELELEREMEREVEREVERERLVFAALVEDQGAGFARWLVHSLAQYYGLSSRSVTVGDPAMREVRVGIREMKTGRGRGREREADAVRGEGLPRPLWGMV